MADKTKLNAELSAAVTEVVSGTIAGKKWYFSKTFWANIVAGAAVLAQASYGFLLPAEYQMVALSLINMGLRKISSGDVVW